jgi:hypothetical protein
MLKSRPVKNRTAGTGRKFRLVLVGGLIFGWSGLALSEERPHLQLAPIQFGTSVNGNLGYTFIRNSYGSNTSQQQMLDLGVQFKVRARSYLWQPWFARVSSTVGIGVNADIANSKNSPTTRSGSTMVTGNAALNVLPYSRFPFEALIYRTDTQANGYLSGINSAYINSGLSLTQSYSSLDGRIDSLASYNHDTSGRANFYPENIRDQLGFSLTTRPYNSNQTFRGVGGITRLQSPGRGETSLTDTLVINHLYQPNVEFSVANLLNLYKSTSKVTLPSGSLQQNDYNSQQFSSFAAWRPEGNPLTLTSSARLHQANSQNNTGSTHFKDTNLNLGANYAWSKLLRMYGSVNINDNSGIQTISTNAALSAQKSFGEQESINVGGFRYSRFFGANLGNQTTTTSDQQNQTTTTKSVQQLGLNVGHELSKTTMMAGGTLMTNVNQGLSTVISTKGSPSTHLVTRGAWVWSHSKGRGTSMLSLRAADSRALSGKQNYSQLINFQATRNERLGSHQSLIGNATLQAFRSGSGGVSSPFIAVPSANLAYRHERLFQVKSLQFESILNVQGADILLSQGSSNQQNATTQNHSRVSWDNNLDYFIGRLRMRLHTHLAPVNNIIESSIFFTLTRSF